MTSSCTIMQILTFDNPQQKDSSCQLPAMISPLCSFVVSDFLLLKCVNFLMIIESGWVWIISFQIATGCATAISKIYKCMTVILSKLRWAESVIVLVRALYSSPHSGPFLKILTSFHFCLFLVCMVCGCYSVTFRLLDWCDLSERQRTNFIKTIGLKEIGLRLPKYW